MRRRALLRRVAAGAGAGGLAAGGLLLRRGAPAPDVTALVAGSLQSVADAVPGAAVEAHGSLAVRRLVLEGARDPDALALADPALFDGLAGSVRLFATNALVLAYRPDSPLADAITADWRAALDRARVGRTDPEQDPLGYRTVMAVDLDPALDRSVLDGVEILPETALLRTLEAGALDAAFAYRNMAVEHGLPYVDLPGRIDFSDPSRADHYRTASVDVGDRVVRGGPIRYGAAARTEVGTAWVEALTTGTGRLREAGFSIPERYPERTPLDSP